MREDDAHVKNILLYLCDPDEAYLNRFNGFIQHREHSPFIVRAFTGIDDVRKDGSQPAVLLVSSVFFHRLWQGGTEDFCDKDWACIVFLDEGREKLPFGECRKIWEDTPVDVIPKYQSAVQIYNRLLDLCQEQGQFLIRPELLTDGPVEVVGVFSPEDKRLQKSWALQKAQSLAGEKTCLYITFEESLIPENAGKGMSGLILMLKEKLKDGKATDSEDQKSMAQLDRLVLREGAMDLLAPAACPYDLKEMGEDEWYWWMESIIRYGRYGAIVMNMGPSVPPLCLLELCTQIFVPSGAEDDKSWRDFKNLMEFMGKEGIAQKIQRVLAESV